MITTFIYLEKTPVSVAKNGNQVQRQANDHVTLPRVILLYSGSMKMVDEPQVEA